jgi:hypothetical protein
MSTTLDTVLANNPRRPVKIRRRRGVKRFGVGDDPSSVPSDTVVTA